MSNEKAVATTENRAMTVGDTMAGLGIDARDLTIPRLLLMQNTSEAVGDEKADLGDIMNSQTLEVLGGLSKEVEIVPLKMFKNWRIMKIVPNKQPEFLRNEEFTAANADADWEGYEETDEGRIAIRRDLSYNFFVLLQAEIDAGEAFPAVITFRRTSAQAGKQMATHLFKRAALQQLPYSQTVKLGVKKDKYESNTYAVLEIRKGGPAGAPAIAAAELWLPILAKMTYKIDEDKEESADAPRAGRGPAPAPTVVGGANPNSEDAPF